MNRPVIPSASASITALIAASVASSSHAIIQSTTLGSGLTPPSNNGTTHWDVDDDGTNDFKLRNSSDYSAYLSGQNGGGWMNKPKVGLGNTFQKLTYGQTVSASVLTATTQFADYYEFIAAGAGITTMGDIGVDADNGGWQIGDTGYFGFKFESNGDTFYGWGIMNIFGEDDYGSGYIITEAYYNETANESILVGQVPEPKHIATGLAALALGAAGLRRWRKAR